MLLVLLAAGAVAGCVGDSESDGRARSLSTAADTVPPPEVVDRARAAANQLGQELLTKLFAALDSGGPSRAMAFCADSAQAWTARHASEGVYLRRVSLRVRNPANRPDAAEEQQLRLLDTLHRAGTLPREVVRFADGQGGERRVEYARPILVLDRCLVCHGARDRLSPEVSEILRTRYPADQATGYQAGDLRGMISVRVPR